MSQRRIEVRAAAQRHHPAGLDVAKVREAHRKFCDHYSAVKAEIDRDLKTVLGIDQADGHDADQADEPLPVYDCGCVIPALEYPGGWPAHRILLPGERAAIRHCPNCHGTGRLDATDQADEPLRVDARQSD